MDSGQLLGIELDFTFQSKGSENGMSGVAMSTCNAPMDPCSSPVAVEGALGQTAAHNCKLGKGNFQSNKHEGKKDPKLCCHIVKTLFLSLYLLSKPMEICNTSET